MEKGRALTGCRTRFTLGGKVVGYATSISISETLNFDPMQCIGNIRTLEFVPTGYEVSFSAELFRIIGDSLKANGFFPKTGQTEEEHLTNVLTAGDLTAICEDRKTGKAVATLQEVRVSSQNFTINARGIVGEQVQFVAIVLKDESEI